MDRRTFLLFVLIFAVTNTGCRYVPQQTTDKFLYTTSTLMEVTSPTLKPTITQIPTILLPSATPKLISPTPSPRIEETSTPPPEMMLITNCMDILPSFPVDEGMTGTLVLEDYLYKNHSYFMDMATGVIQSVLQTEDVKPSSFVVSPDGKWLAYQGAANSDSLEFSLIIQSADGSKKIILPNKEDEWDFPAYWLDKQWLALDQHNLGALDTLVLLNPFTGQKQAFTPDYPDILKDDNKFWNWSTLAVYDPTLTKVIYVGYTPATGYKLVLWDRQTSKVILEIPHWGYTYEPPLWSPDGKQFVYTRSPEKAVPERWDEEIFMVSVEGKISQLTYLSNYYTQDRIASYSWSPDGQHIAFWLSVSDTNKFTNDYSLVVHDLLNKESINYCITTHISVPSVPIWSPDNKYLAVAVHENDKSSRVIIVNLVDNWATQIAEDLIPAGWMVEP